MVAARGALAAWRAEGTCNPNPNPNLKPNPNPNPNPNPSPNPKRQAMATRLPGEAEPMALWPGSSSASAYGSDSGPEAKDDASWFP